MSERRADHRRLPVRRGALCAARRAERAAHLPLPDVPEGLRLVLRAAHRRADRRVRGDARDARGLPELRAGRARLLPRLRHAADLPLRRAAAHRRLDRLARRAGEGRAAASIRHREPDCPGSRHCRAPRRPDDGGGRARPCRPDRRLEPSASRSRHGRLAPPEAEDSDRRQASPAAASAGRCASASRASGARPSAIAACARKRSAPSSGRWSPATGSNGPAASRSVSRAPTSRAGASARDCGTPLTYEYDGGIELAIGAFDDPRVAAPVIQVNPADKLPFVDGLPTLPMRRGRRRDPRPRHSSIGSSATSTPTTTRHWPPAGRGSMNEVRLTGGCQCGAVRLPCRNASVTSASAIAACARKRSAPPSLRPSR